MEQNAKNPPIDPNKNLCHINRFWENKLQYFEYHSRVAKAFKQDCENILLEFEARKSLTFREFAKIWQELSFSLVFVGQEFVEELSLFAETCYFRIKKYIMFGNSLNIKVGAFYLLYGIFSKQLSRDVIKIRLTQTEYEAILKLKNDMEERGANDFIYIYTDMKFNNAFRLVSTSRCLGLEAKFTWQERKMKNDIFDDVVDVSPLEKVEDILFSDKLYSLKGIDEACRDYDDAMKKFSKKIQLSKLLSSHNESKVVEDVTKIYYQMKEEFGEPSQPKTNEQESSVLGRRRAIKHKAFQLTSTVTSQNVESESK